MNEKILEVKTEVESIGSAFLDEFEVLSINLIFEEGSDLVWEAHLESTDGSRFMLERDVEGETFFDKVSF